MQPRTGHLKQRTEVIAVLLSELDRLTEWAAAQQRKVSLGGGTAFVPVVQNVVRRIKTEVRPSSTPLVRIEPARPGWPVLSLHEIPECYEARHAHDTLHPASVLPFWTFGRESGTQQRQSEQHP